MTPGQFCEMLLPLIQESGGSVTSWVRSRRHNTEVGGVGNSWHCVGLALDITDFDSEESRQRFIFRARKMGMQVRDETDHVHVEAY